MAISAEELNIILTARDKQFAKAMERSQRQVARFAKNSQNNLSKTSKAFSALGKAVGVLAAAFSARAMLSSVKSVTEQLDEIGKTADRIGITTDALQLLRTTAESAGVAQAALDSSIEKLGKGLAEAAMGVGTAKTALEELNLSADSLIEMGLEDAMGVIADAVNELPSPMQRTAIAMQLFGRSGAPMLNFLREGSSGMEEMKRQARELGVVIDEDLIRNAEDAQTQLDLMSRVIDANLSSALINVAPLIVGASEKIAGLAAGVGSFVRQFNELRDVGFDQFVGTSEYLDSLEAEAEAAGNASDELLALRAQRALLEAEMSSGGIFDEAIADSEANVKAAAQALRDALAAPSASEQAYQAQIELNAQLDAALIAAAAQTEQLKEQARLRGLSAEEAERERIETEKQALIASMMRPLQGQAPTVEVIEARTNAILAAEEFEKAAIAASSILNPVNGIASGTSNAAASASDLADQLAAVAEISPALSAIGLDAEKLSQVMSTVESSMESAFMSMVDGTSSASDAFKAMAAEIIKDLYRVLVVKQITGFVTDAVGGFFGVDLSGSNVASTPTGQASGGAVKSGQPYTVGEHGRELFVPQSAGRILSVSQTKAAMGGGGGGPVQVVYQFQGGVTEADLGRALPLLVERTKREVVDAVQRGGSVARVFR